MPRMERCAGGRSTALAVCFGQGNKDDWGAARRKQLTQWSSYKAGHMSALNQLAETSKNLLTRRGRPHMGTIASPSRYDVVAETALRPQNHRRPAIWRYALLGAFPISLGRPVIFTIAVLSIDPGILAMGQKPTFQSRAELDARRRNLPRWAMTALLRMTIRLDSRRLKARLTYDTGTRGRSPACPLWIALPSLRRR